MKLLVEPSLLSCGWFKVRVATWWNIWSVRGTIWVDYRSGLKWLPLCQSISATCQPIVINTVIHYGTTYTGAGYSSQTYPGIGCANFRCTLWTLKQLLALEVRVHCEISIVLLKRLCTVIFGICAQNRQYWHYCQFCVPIYLQFFLYLHHIILVYVAVGIRGSCFRAAYFIDNSLFLKAQLKRSWQYWQSCIVEILRKTLPREGGSGGGICLRGAKGFRDDELWGGLWHGIGFSS